MSRIALIALLSLSLVACSQPAPLDSGTPTPGNSTPTPTPVPTPTPAPDPTPTPTPALKCVVGKKLLSGNTWRYQIAPYPICGLTAFRAEIGAWTASSHNDYTRYGYLDGVHPSRDVTEGPGVQYLWRDVTDPDHPGELQPIQPL